ncbi:hypothetical protein PBRA_009715 [Plasmodiophora brassicae]|uniref:Uncharacterized protein n=1 Tax=Plasmodiophora brassicae TaxID=37360 RepID=A0A0G4ILQ5_PLABS|nr:hypothetical protein PBRA_009715 [Plasmodiophora brassicae]
MEWMYYVRCVRRTLQWRRSRRRCNGCQRRQARSRGVRDGVHVLQACAAGRSGYVVRHAPSSSTRPGTCVDDAGQEQVRMIRGAESGLREVVCSHLGGRALVDHDQTGLDGLPGVVKLHLDVLRAIIHPTIARPGLRALIVLVYDRRTGACEADFGQE